MIGCPLWFAAAHKLTRVVLGLEIMSETTDDKLTGPLRIAKLNWIDSSN